MESSPESSSTAGPRPGQVGTLCANLATVPTRASHPAAPHAIPFARPAYDGREQEYVAEVLASGRMAGDGKFTRLAQEMLERELGAPKVLLTTSCTSALDMTGLLLDLKPGDEVIAPSFTFTSTLNAYVLRGACPKFADIRPDTLNIDEKQVERLITPRTRAIVVVHYAGVGCEMDAIMDLARRHRLAVVEDNAHGLFGTYRGRPLGSFGAMSTLSFHETKNLSCGEGGALVINDGAYIDRAEILREKGTDRSRFFRGQVDKYTWIDIGSSFLPSDLLAAVLLGQLESRERIQARRHQIWEAYDSGLRGWAEEHGIQAPTVPAHCGQTYHMYYLVFPNIDERQATIERLARWDIAATFHYLPLNLSEMGRRLGGRPGDCPVTEATAGRLLRLPFYTGLTDAHIERVIEAVKSRA
jgi:dTDP-4-amino-4,6-dideoxygalactose transaminase